MIVAQAPAGIIDTENDISPSISDSIPSTVQVSERWDFSHYTDANLWGISFFIAAVLFFICVIIIIRMKDVTTHYKVGSVFATALIASGSVMFFYIFLYQFIFNDASYEYENQDTTSDYIASAFAESSGSPEELVNVKERQGSGITWLTSARDDRTHHAKQFLVEFPVEEIEEGSDKYRGVFCYVSPTAAELVSDEERETWEFDIQSVCFDNSPNESQQ